MNTYSKYAPNVYLAKCPEQHDKGETILVETRHGKDNESIVFNLILYHEGFYYYSIVRADGFNSQERAKAKAERYEEWAGKAEQRSTDAYEQSREGADFLALAEPIKVGHHSENRHRALIERNHVRMGRSIAEQDKAAAHAHQAKYWESRANDIDLSMPESIEFYGHELEKATNLHTGLKDGSIKRSHSYSLTYANKDRKKALKNYETAKELWG